MAPDTIFVTLEVPGLDAELAESAAQAIDQDLAKDGVGAVTGVEPRYGPDGALTAQIFKIDLYAGASAIQSLRSAAAAAGVARGGLQITEGAETRVEPL